MCVCVCEPLGPKLTPPLAMVSLRVFSLTPDHLKIIRKKALQ